MEVDGYGTVVGAFCGWMDVAGLDPREQTWCDEHIIDAGAIVGFACADLGIPT